MPRQFNAVLLHMVLASFVDAAMYIGLVKIEVELLNKAVCDRCTSGDLPRRNLPQFVPERLFHGRHRGVGSRICCSRLRFGFRGADDVPRAVGGPLLNDPTVFDSKEFRRRPNLRSLCQNRIGEVEDLRPMPLSAERNTLASSARSSSFA
jgi:hypothetical protein